MALKQLVGPDAEPFTFATHGFSRGDALALRGVTVSTPSAELAQALARVDPSACRYGRARTGETLSLAGASVEPVPCPIVDGAREVGVLMLSPLLLDDPSAKGRWLDRFDAALVTEAVNRQLTRIAGRPIALEVEADSLYLRLNPRPRRRVVVKIEDGRERYVFGLALPLVLRGPTDDLRLAWAAGIGRKTRMGFGCFGLAEHGLSGRVAR
jgi:CRISPR-associated endoribonuclease Cas6